ncbi:pyridoxamine 5'-phosphate oxidase family protein [Nocardioides bruguierae]|uniref:Pyridoxamine 5'-phosphate oxidase family protein n=1 Tax=Nocardioides bruguierae TaxID=2945102 RepID=A0A9X2IEK6_9ACTN|nr:pyridoxamine 5'-phosphate oxidase family protein [Nocardioides bruguierae]MCL8026665.1 pyridoxamine 5'-phosphate oxidase family protein [Nocardioides bruguierae]MCM0620931.1 pyridoxamine 5'-phosphate oxidase family protein [Nocardioides bruguierae]
MSSVSIDNPVAPLSEEECWARLRSQEIGRLGYRLVDEIHVVPVNYVVVDSRPAIRTDAGNKLLSAALEYEVALEIDGWGEELGWSVLLRGRAHIVGEARAEQYAELEQVPWVPSPKWDVIEIEPAVVTGREVFLTKGRVPSA